MCIIGNSWPVGYAQSAAIRWVLAIDLDDLLTLYLFKLIGTYYPFICLGNFDFLLWRQLLATVRWEQYIPKGLRVGPKYQSLSIPTCFYFSYLFDPK